MPTAKFTWDARKAAANLAKHRVSFDEAKAVFGDRNALHDNDGNADELRWLTIGMSASGILFVAYTEPEENTVHIISARRANRHEQDCYYRQTLP